MAAGLAALAFAVCFMTGTLLFRPSKPARAGAEAVGPAPAADAKLARLGPVAPVPALSTAIPAPAPTAAPRRRARRAPRRAPVVTPQRTPRIVATPFVPEPTAVPTPARVFVPAPTHVAPRPTPRPTPRATPQPTPVQTFDDGGQPNGGSFDDGGGGGP